MPKELAASGGMEAAREAAAPLLRRAAGPEAADRLLEGLARLTPGEIREPEAGPLAKLRARLEAWPELPWKLEDMAEAAFMSKYHLIRSFRRETGLTPHQFQLQNRVRKGQRLLAGPATVAEAAAAGFCDQSHFDRQFKRLVGLTPADYRRRRRSCPKRRAGTNFASIRRPSGPAVTSWALPWAGWRERRARRGAGPRRFLGR